MAAAGRAPSWEPVVTSGSNSTQLSQPSPWIRPFSVRPPVSPSSPGALQGLIHMQLPDHQRQEWSNQANSPHVRTLPYALVHRKGSDLGTLTFYPVAS